MLENKILSLSPPQVVQTTKKTTTTRRLVAATRMKFQGMKYSTRPASKLWKKVLGLFIATTLGPPPWLLSKRTSSPVSLLLEVHSIYDGNHLHRRAQCPASSETHSTMRAGGLLNLYKSQQSMNSSTRKQHLLAAPNQTSFLNMILKHRSQKGL